RARARPRGGGARPRPLPPRPRPRRRGARRPRARRDRLGRRARAGDAGARRRRGRDAGSAVSQLLPKEDRVLVTALALVAALLAFALVASQVSAGRTQAFDQWALDALRREDNRAVPVGPAWLELIALDVTSLGRAGVLITLVLLVLGYLLFVRRFGLALLTLASTAGGWILEAILKASFGRQRPSVVPHLQSVTSSSFPSGHSMLSAVVYLTLGV